MGPGGKPWEQWGHGTTRILGRTPENQSSTRRVIWSTTLGEREREREREKEREREREKDREKERERERERGRK